MNIVSYQEYAERKTIFLREHGDWKVETSPMIEDSYHKTYICEDGHCWYEYSRPIYADTIVEVRGVRVETQVRLLETEAWSTEDKSMYYYEAY